MGCWLRAPAAQRRAVGSVSDWMYGLHYRPALVLQVLLDQLSDDSGDANVVCHRSLFQFSHLLLSEHDIHPNLVHGNNYYTLVVYKSRMKCVGGVETLQVFVPPRFRLMVLQRA